MNTKQLNFFITNEDLLAISLFLKKANCSIVRNNVSNINEAFVSANDILNRNSFQLFILDEHCKNEVYFKYLESKAYYYIDIEKSAVIEFDFGGLFSKELHRSRFYYVCKYYNNGEQVSKDSDFIKWGDSLLRNFKKQFLKKKNDKYAVLLSGAAAIWCAEEEAEVGGGALKISAK